MLDSALLGMHAMAQYMSVANRWDFLAPGNRFSPCPMYLQTPAP